MPSYAGEAFYAYVAGWYDAICPIIARHLAPDGCVVAVQSDNETCYLFHDQTYATDYSPASLALYREHLAAQYGDIATLNAAYSLNRHERIGSLEAGKQMDALVVDGPAIDLLRANADTIRIVIKKGQFVVERRTCF